MSVIKLTNAALEEKEDGLIVLRGAVDPASLRDLKTDRYQREVLPISTLDQMVAAVAGGRTPDIILGMRGEKFDSKGTEFQLKSDVYIIDGLQRVSAGIRMLELGKGKPHIGALVYFNSSLKFEREQFYALNTQGTKLSPNIIIRNLKDERESVGMLFNLCQDKGFPLSHRVTWSQRASRGELISAATLAKTVGRLHSFIATGTRGSRIAELTMGLDRVLKEVGRMNMRSNTQMFFETIDQAWGVRRVTYKDGAVQLRFAFMRALAEVFARHYDFWNGKDNHKLFVSRDMVRKLASFPLVDPTILTLCGSSGGKAHPHLVNLLIEHLNKGKRTGRLRSRMIDEDPSCEDEPATEE